MIALPRRRKGGLRHPERHGIALLTVLYFLVVVGLLAAAVLVALRQVGPAGDRAQADAILVAAAEGAALEELARWDASARSRQSVGSTTSRAHPRSAGIGEATTYITRLSWGVYSVIGEVVGAVGVGGVGTLAKVGSGGDASSAVARRVQLLVRVPLATPSLRSALVSAGDVWLGPGARVVAGGGECGEEHHAEVTLAPGAHLLPDESPPASDRPRVEESAVAADSATYARIGGVEWKALAERADVRFAHGTHLSPQPENAGGRCDARNTNWGDPRRDDPPSPCESRVVLVYAAGDLTLDGGRAQGVLLVEGRLRIAGPFLFSGQIVARGGIESLSDGIELSGIVLSEARGVTGDPSHGGVTPVSFRHQMTLRSSVCDAAHGVASWLQPRIVREHGWAELF